MTRQTTKLEIARKKAEMVWLGLLGAELTNPNVPEPLAIHLMILEIIEGDGTRELTSVPFSRDSRERIDQVQNSWMVSSARKTIPAGVIFIGVTDLGPADSVQIVAPSALAEILDDDVEELADWLSERAAKIASGVLRALGIIPKGEVDIIVET